MNAGLIIAADFVADPQCSSLQEHLRLRSAPCVVLTHPVTAKLLLTTLKSLSADPARSWLATRHAADVDVAATVGLLGVVIVGSGTDRDDAILVRHVPDLAGVPTVMVPRSGGCWHDA